MATAPQVQELPGSYKFGWTDADAVYRNEKKKGLSEDVVRQRGLRIRPDAYVPRDAQEYRDTLALFERDIVGPLRRLREGQVVNWGRWGSVFAGLMGQLPEPVQRQLGEYLLTFWDAVTTDPRLQEAVREYPDLMSRFAAYYRTLAEQEPDPAKRAVFQKVAEEFELEANKPPVLDVTRLPLRSLVLLGARIKEGNWQAASDAVGRLLGARGRVFRTTQRAVHLASVLRNGVLLPNENAINEVRRTGRDELFHSFFPLPRPLTLEEVQTLNQLGDAEAKAKELHKLGFTPQPNEEALALLREADVILFGNATIGSNIAYAPLRKRRMCSSIPTTSGERRAIFATAGPNSNGWFFAVRRS
jgi:hypothetical protein